MSMSQIEYRIVEDAGDPVDEGTDAAWVIYEDRKVAEEQVAQFTEDGWEGAPFRIQERTVSDWRETKEIPA